MAFIHGKDTVVKLNGTDISAYTNTSDFEKTADSHDVTCYGKTAHVFKGGLTNGKATMGGVYDSTAVSGPRALIEPLVTSGSGVTFLRQPEGTGTGKPQDSVTVIVTSYKETSPSTDMVMWTCEMQCSDTINSAAQS